ncbi:thermonuclease family protein [Rhizobium sp. PP-CC-3G-465]|uniref:thermonuclease family protein n=1 Tax=Rhizobium sp. PP-CC-3G-465 TaxID=2135648 RepID=UPI001FE23617
MLVVIAMTLVASVSMAADAVRVVDGDTLDIGGVRYRLHGIDAPESGQECRSENGGSWPCGQGAIEKIKQIVSRGEVACEPKDRDRYGRIVAVCRIDGRDINTEMVSSGFAWAFRKYSADYVEVEADAQRRQVGVWQAPTETPWDFRTKKWDTAEGASSSRKCPIKGNISRKGEKIYHVPWSKDYAKTKIKPGSGERWFCSEDEAIAAGWRPPSSGK